MILIIDDVPDSCDIMGRHLRREGYEVRTAQSAKEAWSILDAGLLPQLIILDVMMPETDGRTLLRSIRQNERLKDIPVVVCTANSSYACMAEVLALGAQGYLVKGLFDRECFLGCVNHYGGAPRIAALMDAPAATAMHPA